jgi:uncharacterized protein DUF1566
MIKKILATSLIITTLLSYEISLDKSSSTQVKVPEPELKIGLVRDDSKEIVIDKTTGLMWQDNIDTKTIKKNRKDAKQYCRSLVFAGYDDWYLPRLKQLKSIVDNKKRNPAIRDGFKNVQTYHYWSSSPNLSANLINVFNIDFKNGQTYNTNRRGKCYVRCARGKYSL